MSTTGNWADNLRAGRTFAGRLVSDWGDEVKEQNYVRRVIDDLWERLQGQAFNLHPVSEKEDALIERIVLALRANLKNPIHYRGHEPGVFGSSGEQLFPEPSFNYVSLVSFGEDGDDGFAGFLKNCDLPPDTPYKTVIACAAVLTIDQALEEIEKGLSWQVTWTIYGITEVVHEIEEIRSDEYLKEHRRKVAAAAGRAAHKETNDFKKEVLQAWAAGQFKTIAACARWACRHFPIEADETPKRWIRAYQKGLLS